jgi:ankyrin repeat protein
LLLADRRVDPTEDGDDALVQATYNWHGEIVKMLLEDGRVNLNNDVMIEAIKHNNIDIVELLLKDKRIEVNGSLLIYTNSTEAIKLLLEDGRADPAYKNSLCLALAHYRGHTDIVKLLLVDNRVNKNAVEIWKRTWMNQRR